MTSTSRIKAGLAVAGLAALALAGCSGGPSSGGEGTGGDGALTKVSVAVLAPGSLQWLHAIAEDQGFYADHGVDIESVQVQSSSALVQAVSSGSANAGIALGDNVIKAVDEGGKLAITGALNQRSSLRLFGASGIDEVDQLEGAQVTAGAVDGGTADLMFYLMQENGLDPSTVVPVAMPNSSDRVVAMQNGQVKGALLIPPFDSTALSDGATMLATYDDYYIQTPAIVNTDWAESDPAGAEGFTRGLQDAAEWIYDTANKDEAVSILAEYAGVEEDAAGQAYEFMVGDEIISPDLSVPEEGLTNIVEVSAEVNGGETSSFDPAKYIDDQYLR